MRGSAAARRGSWIVAMLAVVLVACAPAQHDADAATSGDAHGTASDVARTWYVAPDGSDSAAGTAADPWGTLETALTRLGPGDTLRVHGGVYRERIRNPRTASGRPDAPVTVTAVPGEQPVVEGLLWLKGTDHWVVDGLDVTWDDATGEPHEHLVKLTDGVGWTFRNAEVRGARSFAGVLVASTTAGEPADWTLADSCVHDTRPTNDINQDQLLYVNTGLDAGSGRVVGNLLFGAPNGAGIKLGGPSLDVGGAANVEVVNNTIAATAQNVLVAGDSHDVTLRHNLLFDTAGAYGNIRGYRLEGADVVARDNVGGGAASLLLNDPGFAGVADGGGNRFPVDPGFDSTADCDGFRPTVDGLEEVGHLAARDVESAGEPVVRHAGADRVASSVAVARAGWDRSDDAVLARADDPADALAGAALAGHLDAPLLLTAGDGLSGAVADALGDLDVRRAVLLGGPAALGTGVADDVAGHDVTVTRVAGESRFATAAAVANRVGAPEGTAVVVRGAAADPARAWPDALAVSGLAASRARDDAAWPVLLVGDEVPPATRRALDRLAVERVVVVGGQAAVSDEVARTLGADGRSVERVAGATRYATSRAVAELRGDAPGGLVLATGTAFPDGLAAGPLAGRRDAALLLVPDEPDPALRDWLTARAGRYGSVTAVGGALALPAEAVSDVAAAIAGG